MLQTFILLSMLLIISSCNNSEDSIRKKTTQKNIINVTKIKSNTQTRAKLLDDSSSTGYQCISQTSPIIAEIYPQKNGSKIQSLILNKKNEVVCIVNIKYIKRKNGIISFTAFNEFQEPMYSGNFKPNEYMQLTQIYGNDVYTRAPSANAIGCNLGLWSVGSVWGTVTGMAVAGPAGIAAGLAVSLGYSLFSIYACDGL